MDRLDHRIGLPFRAEITVPKIDLTGCTVASAIRRGTEAHAMTGAISNPGTSVAKIVITATAAQTALWSPGDYAWDLRITKPNGDQIAIPGTYNLILSAFRGAT